MTIKELIQKTGELPHRVVFENGNLLQLFPSVQYGIYRIDLWQMENGKKNHLYSFGVGKTEGDAREDLKQKLLA